ncbi:MAG: class III signal peptide-containing protein [Candidatus Omnitrophica bacterium]|nr:class III signal peptide-containing protein [Candidatus Omnitrophota bacterium]
MRINKKGQSTVEYLVLVAAVVAAILVFAGSKFKPALESTWGSATDKMKSSAAQF